MSRDPVTSHSTLPYQITIFLVVTLWAFISFDVAQFQLVTLYETPLTWIGWATIVLWSMTPILSLSSWKLKETVELKNPDWNFKVREVNLREFEEMVRNYNSNYRYLLSAVDYPLLIVVSLIYPLFCLLPFFTMRTSLLLISITPFILALLALLFGLLFAYLVFKAIPNSASKEFPKLRPRRFNNSISFLSKLPGIFWAGVRVTIGESGGYYTMRNPISVARIEGIEGSARLECELDASGNILLIRPIFELEGLSETTHFAELIQPITTLSTSTLIQEMLHTYIEHSGGEEILEEVLDDILAFQAKHQPEDASSN